MVAREKRGNFLVRRINFDFATHARPAANARGVRCWRRSWALFKHVEHFASISATTQRRRRNAIAALNSPLDRRAQIVYNYTLHGGVLNIVANQTDDTQERDHAFHHERLRVAKVG
jgi:hypothetical protein